MKKLVSVLMMLMLIAGTFAMPVEAATVGTEATTATTAKATTVKYKLSKTKATLKKGKTLKLTVKKLQEGDVVTWKSSKTSVAKVSKTGKVTAKKAGKATITAKIGKKKLTCKITVKAVKKTTATTATTATKAPTTESKPQAAAPAKTTTSKNTTSITATEIKDLSATDTIAKVGPLFTTDQKKTGVLASVSLAQFCLESGYGKSELAQKANNCFGMKKNLSGNTWEGSTWDGVSVYTKKTGEETKDGKKITITADFRKYASISDSIADHSAYLLGAKDGSKLRYEGLKGEKDYKKAIKIIKKGGYATSSDYVDNICKIIEKYNLTKYDVK